MRSADAVLAEDTRHSAKLLRFYDIRAPMVSTLLGGHASVQCQVDISLVSVLFQVDMCQSSVRWTRVSLETGKHVPGMVQI